MEYGKVGFGKDEMLSYKQKHNSAVHVKDNTATEIDRDQIETGVEEYNKGNLNQSEDD